MRPLTKPYLLAGMALAAWACAKAVDPIPGNSDEPNGGTGGRAGNSAQSGTGGSVIQGGTNGTSGSSGGSAPSGAGGGSGQNGSGGNVTTGGSPALGGAGSGGSVAAGGSGGSAGLGGSQATGGSPATAGRAGDGGANTTGGVSGAGGNPSGGSATAGSATAGGSGSGGMGTAGIPNDPNWVPPDMSNAQIVVLYQCGQTAASANEVRMTLALKNQTATAFNLSNVTVRYWLSSEPAPQPRIDYASDGLSAQKPPVFVPNMANSYLEFSFRAGGQAPAYVDQNSLNQSQIQAVVATNINNAKFNQSNDWSFDATASMSKPNPKITVYAGDTLIWGCEPSQVCASVDTPGGEAGAGGI